MNKVAVPILIIATGSGWLLSTNGVLGMNNWAWVLLIGVGGILSLCNGLTKLSIVVGPLLLITSVLVVMLETGRLEIVTMVPVVVITLGVLMFIANLSNLPDGISRPAASDPKGEDEN